MTLTGTSTIHYVCIYMYMYMYMYSIRICMYMRVCMLPDRLVPVIFFSYGLDVCVCMYVCIYVWVYSSIESKHGMI